MKKYRISNSEAIREYLDTEGYEYVVNNDYIDLEIEDSTALWELAERFGKITERRIWSKPETFSIGKKYADVLQGCINKFQEKYYIEINSIKIEERNDNLSEVIVEPTYAVHLFNLGREYQQECDKLK